MGSWELNEISYLKANRAACELCGHPIARRYWAAGSGEEKRMFCSPAHEQLYHSYWLPRYGPKAVG